MASANLLAGAGIGFLAGVLAASFFSVPTLALVVLATFLVILLSVLFRYEGPRNALCATLFVLVGIASYQHAAGAILGAELPLAGSNVSFEARIAEVPDERAGRTFLVLEPQDERLRQRVRATVYEGRYSLGDIVAVSGVLETPENFDDFDYRGWLAKEGIAYVMRAPLIEQTGEREGGLALAFADIRVRLREGIERMLPPPHGSFYRATLLGEYGAFSGPQEKALQALGLSHVVAVSGMHISVLFGMVLAGALAVGLSRSWASYASLLFIVAYVVLIGAPASAVRAGVMGATLIGAERVGRPNSSWRALLLAAFIMVAANPLILRHDAGFQLSFAAIMGITAAFPYRDKLLSRVPEAGGLRTLLLMTLAAQAATLPLVILYFGSFSPLSILANILVVPLSPFLLASAMGVAALGVVGAPIFFAAPAWLLLEYVFTVALWLA